MSIPLTVKVVEGTERRGPVLYEIRHFRDGRTWNVHRRYSTLHAMTEALRAEKVKLPSMPFPRKRWQFPTWHFPCTPVMPLSELEDRRDGLQSYLSALSDLSESWNSPAVTDVLCEEVAVAATLVDDSDASEAHKNVAESITKVPEATTRAVVDFAQGETNDADGTVQPVVETVEESSTPEPTATTGTDVASPAQEPGQIRAAPPSSAPLAQRAIEEEEEMPPSWPEPFANTRQFANPTPDAPVDAELPEAETPVADMLVADLPDVSGPVGDAAVGVAVAEESSADASVDHVSASALAREATDNVAETLSTSASKSDSNDPAAEPATEPEPEQPESEMEAPAEPLEEATTASLVEASAVSAESTPAEASAAAVDVPQEFPASDDAGVDVVVDVVIASESLASTHEVADEISALQDDSPGADDVGVAAPAAETAVMAPASGSNITDVDSYDESTEEEPTTERQQSAMTDVEEYRGRAEASAASRGSDASAHFTSSATLTSRTSSSTDEYLSSIVAGNGAASAASPVAEEAAKKTAAPASKRVSLLSRAKRSLKKPVEEVSSCPTSPAVANSKAPRLSGGSGRLLAFRDKARSFKDRLSNGGTTPLLSSKGKGKIFFSLSSTTANNTNTEGGVGSDTASPGARNADVEDPPSVSTASPVSQPSLTMEGGVDVGSGEMKGSKGVGSAGGEDPFAASPGASSAEVEDPSSAASASPVSQPSLTMEGEVGSREIKGLIEVGSTGGGDPFGAGERGGGDAADNSIPRPPSPGGE